MHKLRFFSTLLLLLFIFVGCDAPFEPSGCPEWDALIELQEENIEHVIYYVRSPNEENSEHLNSVYHNPEVIAIEDIKNQLTREQIEELVALLESLNCEFEKNSNAHQDYYGYKEKVMFQILGEHLEYGIYITFYPDGYVVVENAVIGHQALYSATEKIDIDDYEKLYQFCQEDNV